MDAHIVQMLSNGSTSVEFLCRGRGGGESERWIRENAGDCQVGPGKTYLKHELWVFMQVPSCG
jgi:hypothetical protein